MCLQPFESAGPLADNSSKGQTGIHGKDSTKHFRVSLNLTAVFRTIWAKRLMSWSSQATMDEEPAGGVSLHSFVQFRMTLRRIRETKRRGAL